MTELESLSSPTEVHILITHQYLMKNFLEVRKDPGYFVIPNLLKDLWFEYVLRKIVIGGTNDEEKNNILMCNSLISVAY